MLEKKVLFLSHFLNENTPLYGGEMNLIKFEKIRSISKGDNSNNLKLSFPTHVSTHIDFPFHFDNNGKKCNDYSASSWIFNKVGFVTCLIENLEDQLSDLPNDIECLILKTGFEKHRGTEKYWKEQPIIHSELAFNLKAKFPYLRLLGFDMISLTSKLDRIEGKKAHIAFLIENDILILEDMHLEFLNDTPSQILVTPLLIDGADGSPCNVIAIIG